MFSFKVCCSRLSTCASRPVQKKIVRVDTKFDVSLCWNNLLKSRPNFHHPLFVLHFVVNISSIFVRLKVFYHPKSIFLSMDR